MPIIFPSCSPYNNRHFPNNQMLWGYQTHHRTFQHTQAPSSVPRPQAVPSRPGGSRRSSPGMSSGTSAWHIRWVYPHGNPSEWSKKWASRGYVRMCVDASWDADNSLPSELQGSRGVPMAPMAHRGQVLGHLHWHSTSSVSLWPPSVAYLRCSWTNPTWQGEPTGSQTPERLGKIIDPDNFKPSRWICQKHVEPHPRMHGCASQVYMVCSTYGWLQFLSNMGLHLQID